MKKKEGDGKGGTSIEEESILIVFGLALVLLGLDLRLDEVHRVRGDPCANSCHASSKKELQRMKVISVGYQTPHEGYVSAFFFFFFFIFSWTRVPL